MSGLWRNRTFRYVWCGQTASIFGDRVTGLALPWLILLQTRSASAAGLVLAARYLPLALLGLPAGVLADRVDRRALMIACDVARAVALGAIALLGALRQTPPLWLLATVVLALGAGQLGFGVAYRAWLPDVTGDALLGRANAALEASDAAGTLVGPAVGGALIGAVGPALALGADAVSYVVSAVTLLSTRARDPSPPTPLPATGEGSSGDQSRTVGEGLGTRAVGGGMGSWAHALWDDMVVGLHAVVASPVRRFLLVAGTVLYLDAGAVELLLAALTQLHLRLPAWQAGLVFGAAGAGGLIGSALAPRVYEAGWRRGLAAALAVGALGSVGLALSALLAPAPGFAVALVSNLVLDGAVALCFVVTGTAATLNTPRAVRSRAGAVTAIYASIVRGGAVLGLGAITAAGGALPAFALLAGCFVATAAVAAYPNTGHADRVSARSRN